MSSAQVIPGLSFRDLYALSSVGVVMVVHAFFDGSFTNGKAGITAFGGYVGHIEDWEPVRVEWETELLKWPELGGEFHLKDIARQLGNERGTICVKRFSRIIQDSKLRGIGACLNDVDWTAEGPPFHHYEAAFGLLLDLLGQDVALEYPGEDVVVVVDHQNPSEPIAHQIFFEMQARHPNLAGLTVSNRVKFRALQTADLAAGQWRRAWLEDAFGPASEVPAFLEAVGCSGRFVVRSAKAKKQYDDAIAKQKEGSDS